MKRRNFVTVFGVIKNYTIETDAKVYKLKHDSRIRHPKIGFFNLYKGNTNRWHIAKLLILDWCKVDILPEVTEKDKKQEMTKEC